MSNPIETEDFRVKFLRGTANENSIYTGTEGEITIDLENKDIRMHDGIRKGGYRIPNITQIKQLIADEMASGGRETLRIRVLDYNSGNFVCPTGVVVEKEYSNSSLRITHNRGINPIGWFGLNVSSTGHSAGIVPTGERNLLIVNDNTVIITTVSNFIQAEYCLYF